MSPLTQGLNNRSACDYYYYYIVVIIITSPKRYFDIAIRRVRLLVRLFINIRPTTALARGQAAGGRVAGGLAACIGEGRYRHLQGNVGERKDHTNGMVSGDDNGGTIAYNSHETRAKQKSMDSVPRRDTDETVGVWTSVQND